MLPSDKLKTLHELVSSSTAEELIWINGYLSGLVAEGRTHNGNGHGSNTVKKEGISQITICYGTETGNAKKLALQFTQQAKQSGITVKCANLDQYRFTDLEKESLFLAIVSTQGEGEPPESARKFFARIFEEKPNLSGMKYSILALGDTAYPLYCKAGEDLDKRFEELGASRLLAMQKCDVDYEESAGQWYREISGLWSKAAEKEKKPEQIIPASTKPAGKKIYSGTIQTHINLNDRGSAKSTWHIEIGSAEEIAYEPGDAIAIVPENNIEVVDRIISLAGVDPDTIVKTNRAEDTVRELLRKNLNICYLLSTTIKKYATLTGQEIPETRMDLIDLIRIYPPAKPALFLELIPLLSGIAPRLYSISSSPRVAS